jgi:hypothetical protein
MASHNWLSNITYTEDAMQAWEAKTPREYVLRLYKFLNLCGCTVVGIDAAIEREAKKRRALRSADPTIKEGPAVKYSAGYSSSSNHGCTNGGKSYS